MGKELIFSVTIRDCEVQTFRSGGKGGQNQNKVESGVRVIHGPSGAVGEARDSREQLRNKRNAFVRMATSQIFQRWAKREGYERSRGKTIEQMVDEAMAQENLLIEVKDENGNWVTID